MGVTDKIADLQIYLHDINATPLLSAEEERVLALRVAEGNPYAREHMVKANLRLVVNIARGYLGKGLSLEDLIEEGNLGLMRAVEGYDGAMETRFSTYASYWIKQSIRRSVRNNGKPTHLPAYNQINTPLDDPAMPLDIQEKIIGLARPSGWAGEGSGEISQAACWASIEFVLIAKKAILDLDFPRIAPSPMGAVALQWDFDDVALIVRISSGQPSFIHFQEEGPDFHQEEGVASREEVLARLVKIVANHVLT